MSKKKASKKVAKQAPKSATKAVAKKTASQAPAKAPAKTAKPAGKKTTPKPAAQPGPGSPSPDLIAATAYRIYLERLAKGLPGDQEGDWLAAEQALQAA